MLVLTRRRDESVSAVLTEETLIHLLRQLQQDPERKPVEITVTVLKTTGASVRIGIDADPSIRLLRGGLEYHDDVDANTAGSGQDVVQPPPGHPRPPRT